MSLWMSAYKFLSRDHRGSASFSLGLVCYPEIVYFVSLRFHLTEMFFAWNIAERLTLCFMFCAALAGEYNKPIPVK